jgi:hypothetical protein
MNNEQFERLAAAMLQQGNADRAERQQTALTSQTAYNEKNAKRDRQIVVDSQILATVRCSGSSSIKVCEWLAELEMTRSYFAEDLTEPHQTVARDIDTLKVVQATLQGEMRRCFQAFVDAQPNKRLITWEAVKTHLSLAYLTADEEEYLKAAVGKTKQRTGETTGSYGRRFKEAASLAYSEANRNPAIEVILLNKYIKGLHSLAIKRRVIQETDPKDVDEAMVAVESFTCQELRMQRILDKDYDPDAPEPMEIGVVGNVPTVTPTSDLAILAMQRSMEGLHKELTKLKGNTIYVANPQQTTQVTPGKSYARAVTPLIPTAEAPMPPRLRRPFPVNPMGGPSFTPDKQPICHECQQVGHIQKNCDTRRARLANSGSNYMSETKIQKN